MKRKEVLIKHSNIYIYIYIYEDNNSVMNVDPDGCCRTIKANYRKMSLANFSDGGSSFGSTGVIQYIKEQRN